MKWLRSVWKDAAPLITLVIILSILGGAFLRWHYPVSYSAKTDFVRTVAQIGGGLALLIGVVYTHRTLRNSQDTLELSRRSHDSERFGRATEQLGHEKPSVQVGGLFTLLTLFSEAESNRRAIFNTIHHYVNDVATFDPEDTNARASAASNTAVASLDVIAQLLEIPEYQALYGDNEVPLWGCNFNFVTLHGGSLSNVSFTSSTLTDVTFSLTNLDRAKFMGTSLQRATFTLCSLREVSFERANLYRAKFQFLGLERDQQLERLMLASSEQNERLEEFRAIAKQEDGTVSAAQLLKNADFSNANLVATDFKDIDLTLARGLAWQRLDLAYMTTGTRLPTYLTDTGCFYKPREHFADTKWQSRRVQ